jgi:hypothetical protein
MAERVRGCGERCLAGASFFGGATTVIALERPLNRGAKGMGGKT